MLLVIEKKTTEEEIEKMAQDYEGYIKIVVDVKKEILAGGGEKHVEGEQRLLSLGSQQRNLWGGGIDWETKDIDYNSIINLRPGQENPSRDILSSEVRKQFNIIIKKLLL